MLFRKSQTIRKCVCVYMKILYLRRNSSSKILIISDLQLTQLISKTLENEKSKYRSHHFLSNSTLKHCRNQCPLKGINGLCRLRYFMNQYVNNKFNSETQLFGKRKSSNFIQNISKPRRK